jgi:alkylation response protein AidB-like acyl-CoA dehydrogenase
MSLFLSKDEEAFKTKVQNFASSHVIPQANEVEAGKYPRDLIREMGREGLLGAPFSKSDGGQGLGWVSEVTVAEAISAASAATEMSRAASTTLYAAPLAYFGSKQQKKDFLQPVLAGASIGALALTEPLAGSDAAAIRTAATSRGDNFVLNGEKRFITNGGVADQYFLFAITDRKKGGRNGMSAFLVPRESPGVKVIKAYSLLGMKGANIAHIRFRNVKLPPENLVGQKDGGFKILLDELDRERPVVSAEMLGIARAAYNAALEYSNSREQFGRPIREFQAVSFRIADMAVKLEASRLLILKSARLLDLGRNIRRDGAIAKVFVTEASFDVANSALQVHGGIGYTTDTPVERYFRDARFMMIGGGTSEIMRHIIQREAYGDLDKTPKNL